MNFNKKINYVLFVVKTNICILLHIFFTFYCFDIKAQIFSKSTTFGNDSIDITYNLNGVKGRIYAPHKIPINAFPIKESITGKKANNPSDIIKISSLNYKLIDSLVWIECNIYRKEKKLNPVLWNDTLYLGSIHHSQYQAYYNIIGHGETDSLPGKTESQKHYNKMRYFCAEICLKRSFIEGKTTYTELAKAIIEQWKNSPGHNAIMITPKYKFNAFSSAIQFDVLSLLTRENLLKYNPELLTKIESVLPDYFKKNNTSNSYDVWCTGNFTDSDNIKENIDHAEYYINNKHEDLKKQDKNKSNNNIKKAKKRKKRYP
ncbi:MAG: CAP domain-containing protein [Bacteroidia bacterium]|nr:CAP domain-containing protein [Bacteroidia bacterium]